MEKMEDGKFPNERLTALERQRRDARLQAAHP